MNRRAPSVKRLRSFTVPFHAWIVGGLLVAAGTAGIPAVHAASALPPVQISGVSPFGAAGDCGNFPSQLPGANSTLFVNSELEPWIDVNPANPNNIVATWQQDRWSDGGSRGLAAGVSFDGGSTWQTVPLPNVTDCTGGPWERASDPWLSFGPNGTLYHMSLVFQIDPADNRPGGFGPNAMVVSRSSDGGVSWSDPVPLIEDADPRVLNDKNSLTADPAVLGYAYAVWDRLKIPAAQTIIVPNPMELPRHLGIYFGVGFKGPAMFSRTTDGGFSWEPPRVLYDPGANNQTINNRILVLPDGTLIDFFTEILNNKNADRSGSGYSLNLSLLRSTDKGDTFAPRGQPIRAQRIFSSFGAVTPDTAHPVRDASILFDVADDPQSGNLYLVWQDTRFRGVEEVAFSMSSDGGFTWSAPIRVNLTPANSNPLRQQAFLPSVAVNASGVISVSYYDFRNDVDGPAELTDFWEVFCDPGIADCTAQASWTPSHEVRLTAASFDITQTPMAGGYFLGDYAGHATDGVDFISGFAHPHAGDPDSIFFVRSSGP